MINSRGSSDAGDREVMRHGTEVVLVREGGWAQDWAQKWCGRISFVGTEASSQGGQVRGWSVEEAGDSSWHR